MGIPVRLFGAIYPHKSAKISGLTLRVVARGIPDDAQIQVTDVQLEPGSFITGWTLNSVDLGVEPVEGWQFRNGVVRDGLPVVVTGDVLAASPSRWDIRGAVPETVTVDAYQFGEVASSASVDGWSHTASQGAGIPPHMTARADVPVDVTASGRVMATCWYRGQILVGDQGFNQPTHVDQGMVTDAHGRWADVLAFHGSWTEVIDTHAEWSTYVAPPPPIVVDGGPVTTAHPIWPGVTAAHGSWSDVRVTHQDWS